MMTDFTFAATPLLYAGAGKRAQLPALIRSFGVHVLLVMGGGSFKRSQFYTECVDSLQSHGFMLNEVAIGHRAPGATTRHPGESRGPVRHHSGFRLSPE